MRFAVQQQPQIETIEQARERARGIIQPSPLIHSNKLSQLLGSEIFLKLENLQETGSFKVRGAFNRLDQLDPEERKKGVITASAGNHAQGVAWASSRLGIQATVVMPEDVSIRKLLSVREYGAKVILFGTCYDDAYSHAHDLSMQTGKILIPAFDDPHVIAGQGTIGLEIDDLLEDDCAVVAPIGGGGLISGIAIAAKERHPQIRIIGVQTNSCPSAIRSLEKKGPTSVEIAPTLADGIAVKRPGELTFSIMERYVDEVVGVDEEMIAGGVLTLLERVSIVAEGAGATPLAAFMDNKISIRAKRYILIISGGNIEISMIDRILQRGSIKMGRLIRIEVNLLDTPGSLWKLLGIIAKEKANILHIIHDRLSLNNPIQVSRVELNLETRGPDHSDEIIDCLRRAGYEVSKSMCMG